MTTVVPCARLVIGNDVVELRRMTQWLMTSCVESGIPQDLLFTLDVCANEAVSNIISYAYDDSRGHEITLELSKTATGACLVIRDDGKPFNVLEAPEHHQPESLANARIGGLGIRLIRGLMSRCAYRRENGINVLCLEAQRTLQPHD